MRTGIVEHALLMVAQYGRVVLRRSYGNPASPPTSDTTSCSAKHSPCVFDANRLKIRTRQTSLWPWMPWKRCSTTEPTRSVWSPATRTSYLRRRLRDRGSTVFIVGEPKTLDAPRSVCEASLDNLIDATPSWCCTQLIGRLQGSSYLAGVASDRSWSSSHLQTNDAGRGGGGISTSSSLP